MMLGSVIVGLMLVAFVVVGVLWLTRTQQGATPGAGERMSAKAILDARYARGEIDDAEYAQRRDVLTDGSAKSVGKA
ncbi:MAG: SHOCT domain-containing protein [Candidatus Dormibacteria bacterium]